MTQLKHLLILISVLFTSYTKVSAQGYAIFDIVPDFALQDALGDTTVHLYDFIDSNRVVVVVFTTQSCPYSQLYEERLIKLCKAYLDDPIQFIWVNSNSPENHEDEHPISIKNRAKEMVYPFPYLMDPDKKIARQFGVTKTPHAFVMKRVGKNLILYYAGGIDDNPGNPHPDQNYLKDAIDAILINKSVVIKEAPVRGCRLN
jgi:peroxiredoxin